MNLSSIVERWDGILFWCYNIIATIKYIVLWPKLHPLLKKNKELKKKYNSKRCFILMNGPSVAEHDLSVLKDEVIFVSNYFYKAQIASNIHPTFYCWLDSLLMMSEEGKKTVDAIKQKYPETKLILNSKSYRGDKERIFYTYNKHLPSICGIRSNLAGLSSGFSTVALYAVNAAIYMGFNEIFVLGLDFAPGAFKHFDPAMGECEDPTIKRAKIDVCGNYWSYTKAHYESYALNKYAKKLGVRIVNLNKDSYIRAFEFDDYERVIGSRI